MAQDPTTSSIPVPDNVGPLAHVIDPQKVPTMPVRSGDSSPTSAPLQTPHKANGRSWWKNFRSLISFFVSKSPKISSYIALITVIVWAFIEIKAIPVSSTVDHCFCLWLFLLTGIEFIKTTSDSQNNRADFATDLITGTVQFTLYFMVMEFLYIERRIDYSQFMNLFMLFFVCFDAFVPALNRNSMLSKRVLVNSPDQADHHHGDHHTGCPWMG